MPLSDPREAASVEARVRSGRRKLLAIALICAAPIVAAFIVYFFVRPDTRNNYGALIEPQRPVPDLHLATVDGRPFDLRSLKGQWVLLMVDGGACDDACQKKLYLMRQVRTSTGQDMDRIERVWIAPDTVPLSTMVMREYEGTHFLRGEREALATFLPVGEQPGARLADHIWVIDPVGNLMMRFPKDPDARRLRRDVAKLAYNTRGWMKK